MRFGTTALALLSVALVAGCSTSSTETASRDKVTAHVGVYDPPPAGARRVKVGIPPFKVEPQVSANFKKELVARDAADQLTTLAVKSERFNVIERAQLDQLLKEQGLEGIVDPDELARPGRVKGVDYLLIGKVTNMRVKGEKQRRGFGIGSLSRLTGAPAGLFDWRDSSASIRVECGVDLRLVDPTTGSILAADFSEYNKTDSIGASGLVILGIGGGAEAELKIDEDSRGKILRLALDDCLRKMLPKTDRGIASAKPKCKCGAELKPDATFCTKCGAKVGGETITCACGNKLPANAKFCGKCGKKVGGGQGAAAPRPAPAPAAAAVRDYLPANLYIARVHANSDKWAPAIMKSPPVGEKKQAEFLDVRSNREFVASQFFKTRPAAPGDIKAGASIFVMWDSYRKAGLAPGRWKNSVYDWIQTTVTDTQGLNAGVFQAPVSGSSRDIHVSNVRVAVK